MAVMNEPIKPTTEDYEKFFKINPNAIADLKAIVFERLYLEEKAKNEAKPEKAKK